MKSKTKPQLKIQFEQPEIICEQPFQWAVESWKNEKETPEMLKEFNAYFQVIVAGCCFPPRDEKWEFFREMGSSLIEDVLYHRKGTLDEGDLVFVFPDNHMIPAECRQFIPRLNTHPDIKDNPRRHILIVTKDPLIVGSCLKEQLRNLQDGGKCFKKLNSVKD